VAHPAVPANPSTDSTAGARRYWVFRRVDNDHQVLLDLDFDTMKAAGEFVDILRNEVWPSPDNAQAKVGTPSARIIDLVEGHDY
jgi:hypothetical protein